MISSLLSPFAYNYLRTDRMLGYIVSTSSMSIGRSSYLYVLIQGNKEPPPDMDNHIEEMLRKFKEQELGRLGVRNFYSLRNTIIDMFQEPDETLGDRTDRIWKEIVSRYQDFHLKEKLIEATKKCTPKGLKSFFDAKIAPEDPSTVKKLSIQLYSKDIPKLPEKLDNAFTPYKGNYPPTPSNLLI
jgi:insulysin